MSKSYNPRFILRDIKTERQRLHEDRRFDTLKYDELTVTLSFVSSGDISKIKDDNIINYIINELTTIKVGDKIDVKIE